MDDCEIKAWKDFALRLRRLARWDLEKIDRALEEAFIYLSALNQTDRTDLLRLGQAVSERSSKLAVVFLRSAPKSLQAVLPAHRFIFLKWAEILAENSRETLIDFLEKSGGILEILPEKEGLKLLAMGLRLAQKDWAVSFKFFLNLKKIIFEVKKENLARWFETGISILEKSPLTAMAYYSLESKKSRECGKMEDSAIDLEDRAGPLRILSQAMTGKTMGVRPLRDGNSHRSAFSGLWPFTDGECIYLPEIMDEFSSFELNAIALKLAAAHQAGQVEFGTFQFNLSGVSPWFPTEVVQARLQGIVDKEKSVSHLEAFFGLFPKRDLARDLFIVSEGARIDYFLRKNYRGLAKDMGILLPEIFKKRPALQSLPLKEAFVEALLQMGAFGKIEETLPWPISFHYEHMDSLLSSLFRETATVQESARIAVIFYRWLATIPNIRFSAMPSASGWKLEPILTRSISDQPGMDFVSRLSEDEKAYTALPPLSYRGELRPDLVQKKLRIREIRNLLQKMEGGIPLSPEALRDLLKQDGELDLEISDGEMEEFWQGLFATDLKTAKTGGSPLKQPKRGQTPEGLKSELKSLISEIGEDTGEDAYFYDEWDYLIHDYRDNWCRLKEKGIQEEFPDFVPRTLSAYADLVKEVRRQFQMLKPERYRKIPHLERGEEIDLNAAIEASADRRAGQSPSEKIYIEKNRKDRDFSTLFLLDLSASTDERVDAGSGDLDRHGPAGDKKVIDIEKEALVIMAEALDELGDEYAIFGFSGYGRKEVDFFTIKDFPEQYGEAVKGRIGGLKPQRSTRMGPAIRHAVAKMTSREQKVKNIILISDGYPQDYDYGEDRTSKDYALRDTTMALEEAARQNIHTFCITVDRAGYDYLRKMCHPSRYLVIEETCELPRELPKIYRRLTT